MKSAPFVGLVDYCNTPPTSHPPTNPIPSLLSTPSPPSAKCSRYSVIPAEYEGNHTVSLISLEMLVDEPHHAPCSVREQLVHPPVTPGRGKIISFRPRYQVKMHMKHLGKLRKGSHMERRFYLLSCNSVVILHDVPTFGIGSFH